MKGCGRYGWLTALLVACWLGWGSAAYAWSEVALSDTLPELPKALRQRMQTDEADSLTIDSLRRANAANLKRLDAPVDTAALSARTDSLERKTPGPVWIPNSTKAVWLAAVFPGGGQIYNRKYWKLPIFYGGFVGCAYALSWNNQMYSDYSQAYLDIMDDNPQTNSYLDFLPTGANVDGRLDFYKTTFKKKKDFYRRNRDLSIFCFIGVYLLSIIDAYVDAELSNFDISKDLGLRVEPSVVADKRVGRSVGLQCSIRF